MVGELPPDFLRVTSSAEQRQIAADRQQAAMMQAGGVSVFAPTTSRLSITVAQVQNLIQFICLHVVLNSESFETCELGAQVATEINSTLLCDVGKT